MNLIPLLLILATTAKAAAVAASDRFEIIEPPPMRFPVSRRMILVSTLPIAFRGALQYRHLCTVLQQQAISQRDSPAQLWIANMKDISAISTAIETIKSDLAGQPIDNVIEL